MKNLQEIYNENKVDETTDEEKLAEMLVDLSVPYFEEKEYHLEKDDMDTVEKYGMDNFFWEERVRFLKREIKKIKEQLENISDQLYHSDIRDQLDSLCNKLEHFNDLLYYVYY